MPSSRSGPLPRRPTTKRNVFSLQLRELLSELEQSGGNCSRCRWISNKPDRVEMSSGHDDVVVVRPGELGDHVGLRLVHHRTVAVVPGFGQRRTVR